MNYTKKEKNNDIEDRFTPEGIPVTTTVRTGIKGICSQLFQIMNLDAPTYTQTKIKKAQNSIKKSKNKDDSEVLNSLIVVIILILVEGFPRL